METNTKSINLIDCDSCDFCDSCDSCKNLKMTEHNYFCWAKEHNDKESFQQKRYRVFNVEVGETEYFKIKKIYHELEFNGYDDYYERFENAFKKMWDKLSQEEKQEYYDIPHFNWEGFTFITGIKKDSKKQELLDKIEELKKQADEL